MTRFHLFLFLRRVFPWLLAVLTLAVGGSAFRGWIESAQKGYADFVRQGFSHSGLLFGATRSAASAYLPPDASVFLVHKPKSAGGSELRFRQLMLAWLQCPEPVRFGEKPGDADCIFAEADTFSPETDGDGLPSHIPVFEEYGWRLWVRHILSPPTESEKAARTIPVHRELPGTFGVIGLAVLGAVLWRRWDGALAALLFLSAGTGLLLLLGLPIRVPAVSVLSALTLLLLFLTRRAGAVVRPATENPGGGGAEPGGCRIPMVVAAGVALFFTALVAWMALSHNFSSPASIGVFGGRAKLFYLAGIPPGLFTDPAYRFLEPSYPPGSALLFLASYGFSGCCGERLPQLFSALAMGLVLFRLLLAARHSPGLACWILAFFLCPTTLLLATQGYAEPFVLLCLLSGWERTRDGADDIPAWILAGAAGWFKNEGLLYFLLLWGCTCISGGPKAASLRSLAAGILLPGAWFIGSRLLGAEIQDYAPVWTWNPARGWEAVLAVLSWGFGDAWRFAFVFPVFSAGLLFRLFFRVSPLPHGSRVLFLFSVLCLPAFVLIYGWSTAPDFFWHLISSLDRLLWTPALIFLLAFASSGSRNTAEPSLCRGFAG